MARVSTSLVASLIMREILRITCSMVVENWSLKGLFMKGTGGRTRSMERGSMIILMGLLISECISLTREMAKAS